MPTTAPTCARILAHVEDGRLVRVEGDPDQPFTAGFVCAKVRREPELVHSPDRVRTPLRRTGPKGAGRFRPVSWDEALDQIVDRWQAIRREDGPLGDPRLLPTARTRASSTAGSRMALFHALGTTRLQPGTICDTCADVAWESTCGPVGGADPESMAHSDLIVSWSADLVTTAVHAWAKAEEARARGTQFVVIDPRRSRTAAQADWHIAPRIGTDAALALGMMHVLVRDGPPDRDYLARQTVGFDRLEREVLPRFDPDRVAAITGLPRADVERLAQLYGRARAPYIRIGFGMSRSSQGGQGMRAVACLPAVVGAYGKRGGGALLATVGASASPSRAVRRPSGPAATRLVNHSRLGQALLEMRDPPIRALFVSANNPAVTCPDSAAVRRGLMREDLFTVVHDPFLTDTARYADLVLPATTYLETEDLFRAYGAYYVQFAPQAVPAQGEAWSNVRLAQELARRLGVRDAVFSMATPELVRAAFVGATGAAATLDPDALSGRRADQGRSLSGRAAVRDAVGEARVLLRDARIPGARADARLARGRRGDGPRAPVAAALADGARVLPEPHGFLRQPGPPAARGRSGGILHPAEADRRGLAADDEVDLFNDLGTVSMRLRVSDEVAPGIVLVPGQRPAGEAVAGTVNLLCRDRLSDFGEGATYQSTFLDVKRAARA